MSARRALPDSDDWRLEFNPTETKRYCAAVQMSIELRHFLSALALPTRPRPSAVVLVPARGDGPIPIEVDDTSEPMRETPCEVTRLRDPTVDRGASHHRPYMPFGTLIPAPTTRTAAARR